MTRSVVWDLGADDYMTKPFSPSEMVARVKAHLARYERLIGSGMSERIEVIEIRGPEDRHDRPAGVGRRQRSATFTTKEFDLLRPFLGTATRTMYLRRKYCSSEIVGYGEIDRGHRDSDGAHQEDPGKSKIRV